MPSLENEKETCLGFFVIAGTGSGRRIDSSALPLESINIEGDVRVSIATINVIQQFSNPFAQPVELEFLFPLPHKAAITDLEIQIGERRIRAAVEELEKARQTYQDGKDQGQRAALMEERRPNLFSLMLANILPGEKLTTRVSYQERLEYTDGSYIFVFPMGITPKYHQPEDIGMREKTDAPLALKGERIAPVKIELHVDVGKQMGEVTSPSHPIIVTPAMDGTHSVTLAGEHIPDHDFVLRFAMAPEKVAAIGWFHPGAPASTFCATIIPPVQEQAGDPTPREFIFVLDRSGSMSGEPIAQARNALRACLRTLNPNDRFALLLFDDQLDWYKTEAVPVTQSEVDNADHFLDLVEGRGGTEIVQAIHAALTLPSDRERMRYVVFLTDGAVSAEEKALDQIRRKLGNTRLFSFGIGPSVNRALLSRMAELGRGMAEFLQLDEDIEGAILRFQDRVSFPALTDLTLMLENATLWDVYPSPLPDLYIGQPLEIVGKYKENTSLSKPLQLSLIGTLREQQIEVKMSLEQCHPESIDIPRLWAKARVDHLLEEQAFNPQSSGTLRQEIIGLAIEKHLMTPYTSFVAVDTEKALADGATARRIAVSQPLPQGLQLAGFMPPPAAIAFSVSLGSGAPAPQAPFRAKRKSNYNILAEAETGAFDAAAQPAMGQVQQTRVEEAPPKPGVETLRRLAHTQRMDGSWDENIGLTAIALLAFVRHGHTTRSGNFRIQVKRAFTWLSQDYAMTLKKGSQTVTGMAAFLRALALTALAQATGMVEQKQVAAEAVRELPQPASGVETYAAACLKNGVMPLPQAIPVIRTADELTLTLFSEMKNWQIDPEFARTQHTHIFLTAMEA